MKTSSAECVLALDAGGTTIKGALVARDDTVSDFFEIPIMENGSAEAVLGAFAAAGESGAASAAARGLSLLGVGVCIPGPFDYKNGVSLMTHKYQAVRGLRLGPHITKAMPGLKVGFMHDSSAFLMGEMAARPYSGRDICAVLIGTGLGFACTKGGLLFENENGGPGISIFRRPFQGETAEEFVSKRGILRAYSRLGGAAESVKEMADLARLGDGAARKAFEETGDALGNILAPILLENHFSCMILGGQIAKAGALLASPVQRFFEKNQIPCQVEAARHIDESPLVGAAKLILGADGKKELFA